jgi:prepilin-type N-terminal cleavage/methylation domain-containing protein
MIKKNQKGFTLIELIIAISVIVISSSLLLASYKNDGKKNALLLAGQKMVSDIKTAQSASFTSKKLETTLPYGWGIYFDIANNHYITFADLDNDKLYDVAEKNQEIDLSQNITLDSITANNTTYNQANLFFEIDSGSVLFEGSQFSTETSTIKIINQDNTPGYITINNMGAISFSTE